MFATHAAVYNFHQKFGVKTNADSRTSRWKFLREEVVEVKEALDSGDRLKIARELADLIYVAYGTAIVNHIYLDDAIEEVHNANMRKLGSMGEPLRAPDTGKVLKPRGWKPPDVSRSLLPEVDDA